MKQKSQILNSKFSTNSGRKFRVNTRNFFTRNFLLEIFSEVQLEKFRVFTRKKKAWTCDRCG